MSQIYDIYVPLKKKLLHTRPINRAAAAPTAAASRVSPPAVEVQYLQKRNPLYGQLKEDTVWSMRSFNAYVNERLAADGAVPRDWVLGAFTVSYPLLSGTNYQLNDSSCSLQLIEMVAQPRMMSVLSESDSGLLLPK